MAFTNLPIRQATAIVKETAPAKVIAPSPKISLPPSPKIEPKKETSIFSMENPSNFAPFITIAPKKVVALPSIAFGATKWAEYFGDVGDEPPLPSNIDEILASRCPFFSGTIFSRKTVKETHFLTLIPKNVDGKPFTLNRLEELAQKPKKGSATKYSSYWDEIKKEHGDTPIKESYWVLLTRDVIPNSRSKTYDAQKKLVEAKEFYQVPLLLEAATSILMEYVQSGTRLYNDSPYTYIRCQDRVSKYPNSPLVVGGFAPGGLLVDSGGDDYEYYGVGGSRKFS